MKHLFLLICLCLSIAVKANIQNIPDKDIKKIKIFFDDLIARHDFAYTIFGSKPMAMADYGLKVPEGLSLYKRIRSWYRLLKRKTCLETWYKFKHEFNCKEFIFLDEEKDLLKCLVLALINKKNMLRVLHEHEAIFQEELGNLFTPESFLEKLEKREVTLAESIKKNQKLLGIMLGYGTINASLFQQRYNLTREISKRNKDNLPQEDLNAQLTALEAQVDDFSELEEDALIPPLYFLADLSHPETIALKSQYDIDRSKIEEMRKSPQFMDCVLQRLAE